MTGLPFTCQDIQIWHLPSSLSGVSPVSGKWMEEPGKMRHFNQWFWSRGREKWIFLYVSHLYRSWLSTNVLSCWRICPANYSLSFISRHSTQHCTVTWLREHCLLQWMAKAWILWIKLSFPRQSLCSGRTYNYHHLQQCRLGVSILPELFAQSAK